MQTQSDLNKLFPDANKTQLDRLVRFFKLIESKPNLTNLQKPIIGYDEHELAIYVVWINEDGYLLDISFYDNGRCEWYFSHATKDIGTDSLKECNNLYFKEDGCVFYLENFVKKEEN